MNRRAFLSGIFAAVALIYQPSILKATAVEHFKAIPRKLTGTWTYDGTGPIMQVMNPVTFEMEDIGLVMARDLSKEIDE
jgi:hypothetical protein